MKRALASASDRRLAELLGSEVLARSPLSGGCIADVAKITLAEGRVVVVKAGARGDGLDLEGRMLCHLGDAGWPVPAVLHAADDLLVIDFVESDGHTGPASEEHAADLIAALHAQPQPAFGFVEDTLIAGLAQRNPGSEAWIPFFAEHRLLAMAIEARDAGQLEAQDVLAVERLAGRLDRWLREPEHPSLIHGDLWSGNLLFTGGRLAAVIDPACYWADAEIELAFTTLFSTFGDAFFGRYREHRPIAPGFFEERCDLYNLYPLLVHARLFGGHYRQAVRSTLARFGAG